MKKKVISVFLVLTMLVGCSQVVSASKLSEAKNGLNSANQQISDIESRQSSLQQEISALDSELVDLLVDIDVIQEEITDKEAELQKAQSDLAVAQEKEKEQYEAMKKRIKYMYESGDTSLMTALLESDSFADVLNKVSYFNEVYDYDRNLLDEYEATKTEVENLVSQVEEDKAELEENQASLEEQQKALETKINTKKSEMSDFDSKLAEAKQLAAEYKQTIDEQNAIIAQQTAAAQSNASTGASNVASNKSSGSGSSKSDSGSKSDSVAEEPKSSGSSSSSSSGSGSGGSVVSYASQFIGNKYVYGGTSLTNGADCSGFVMSVYAHFGVSLPHSSSAMRGVGYGVSVSDMQPGDIVCYSGHVGIYVGNNTIINASNSKPYPAGGIKYQSATYKKIICVRRIF